MKSLDDRTPAVAATACAGSFAALGAITSMLGAAIPALEHIYRLSAIQAGTGISAYNMGALATMGLLCLPIRVSRRWTPVFYLSVIGGCTGMAVSSAWSPFLASAALAGAGYGGLVVQVNAYVARRFQTRGVTMSNIINAAYGVGAIAGPVLVRIGLRRDLLIWAAFAGMCMSAGTIANPETARPAGSAQGSGHLHLRRLLPFAMMAFLYAGLETGTASWESSDLVKLGYQEPAAVQFVGLFWIGLTLGRLGVPLVSRGSPGTAILMGSLSLLIAVLPLALMNVTAPYIYGVAGLAVGPLWPTLITLAAQRADAAGRVTACVALAESSGNIAVPLAMGFCLSYLSFFCLPLIAASLAAVTLALSRTVPAGWQPEAASGHA